MVKKTSVPESVQCLGSHAVQLYFDSIADGDSPKMAEMLACKQAPGCVTETSISADFGSLEKQLGGEKYAREYARVAKQGGVTINDSHIYNPMLADFPGDPKGFISRENYRSEVKKKIVAKGVSAYGTIRNKGRGPTEDPFKVRMDPKTGRRTDLAVGK